MLHGIFTGTLGRRYRVVDLHWQENPQQPVDRAAGDVHIAFLTHAPRWEVHNQFVGPKYFRCMECGFACHSLTHQGAREQHAARP